MDLNLATHGGRSHWRQQGNRLRGDQVLIDERAWVIAGALSAGALDGGHTMTT